jgi:lycopene beta-cyclase
MYCLPINENQILVESTIFSKNLLPDEWYKHQIRDYISQHLQLEQFEIIEEEKGILPMYEIKNKNADNYINIGTRGGATKISSGYAFSFFLRKLTSNIDNYHSYWDEWMDKIFVHFLLNNHKTEHIFIRMSQSLTGDEFSSFMMGIADFKTKIKVILSMPKKSFIKSFIGSLLS